jgi:hypothetical protein
LSGLAAGSRRPTPQMDLCARSCHYCSEACTQAIQHGRSHRGVLTSRRLVGVLVACKELLRMTECTLRDSSPLHTLMCEACAGACTACGGVCDALLPIVEKSDEAPVLKEVGDTCWIAAEVCREIVAGRDVAENR